MQQVKQKKKNNKILILNLFIGIGIGILLVLVIQYFNSFHSTPSALSKNQEEKLPKSEENEAHANVPVSISKEKKTVYDTSFETGSTAFISDSTTSNIYIGKLNEPEDSIAQDQLLFQKTVLLSAEINTKQQELDSLLIDDKTPAKPNRLLIEFWRSPVNYTGYRMSSEKLILFGFYQFDETVLELKGNKILLKYKGNVFLLENTDEYKPLYLKRSAKK